MSDQDFFFALDVSGDPASDQMLADLARTVLGHVGYAGAAIDALTGELRGALAERVAERQAALRGPLPRAKRGSWKSSSPAPAAPTGAPTWPLPAS